MNALQKVDSQVPVLDMGISELGQVFFASKLFPNVQSAAQAQVKIMAGAENGFGPFTSMSGIHLISTKGGTSIELGADMHATAIKRSAKYDYQVKVSDRTQCQLVFWEFSKRSGAWEQLGMSTYTMEDAKAAGLAGKDNWKNFPDMMLFARAMTNGVARYCPDVFQSRLYADGELSVDLSGTDETGETGGPEKAEDKETSVYSADLLAECARLAGQGVDRGLWGVDRITVIETMETQDRTPAGNLITDKYLKAMIDKMTQELAEKSPPPIDHPDEATLAVWMDMVGDAEMDLDAFRAARKAEDWTTCHEMYVMASERIGEKP